MLKVQHGVLSIRRSVCNHEQVFNHCQLIMKTLSHQFDFYPLKTACNALNRSTRPTTKFALHKEALLVIQKFTLSVLFFGAASAFAATEHEELRIEVSGFESSSGQVIAKIFSRGDNVLKEGRWKASSSIDDKQATLTFRSLPPGEYAVVVFHDINSNGIIDHNFIGLPKEPLGFSNNFSLSLTSGLPNFEKLRFTHTLSPQTISIKLNP